MSCRREVWSSQIVTSPSSYTRTRDVGSSFHINILEFAKLELGRDNSELGAQSNELGGIQVQGGGVAGKEILHLGQMQGSKWVPIPEFYALDLHYLIVA